MSGPQQKGKIAPAGKPRAGHARPLPRNRHKKIRCSPGMGKQRIFYCVFYASTKLCSAQMPSTRMPRAMRYQPKIVKVCFLT